MTETPAELGARDYALLADASSAGHVALVYVCAPDHWPAFAKWASQGIAEPFKEENRIEMIFASQVLSDFASRMEQAETEETP